jgi:hypothetical protein
MAFLLTNGGIRKNRKEEALFMRKEEFIWTLKSWYLAFIRKAGRRNLFYYLRMLSLSYQTPHVKK